MHQQVQTCSWTTGKDLCSYLEIDGKKAATGCELGFGKEAGVTEYKSTREREREREREIKPPHLAVFLIDR